MTEEAELFSIEALPPLRPLRIVDQRIDGTLEDENVRPSRDLEGPEREARGGLLAPARGPRSPP